MRLMNALIVFDLFAVTVQVVAVNESQLFHSDTYEPSFGETVMVTRVPGSYEYEHTEPQLMPFGDEVNVPDPVP
jgi:hypothetical protein